MSDRIHEDLAGGAGLAAPARRECDRAVRRLGRLVECETPSRDATRLHAAYDLIEEWGSPVFGRAPDRQVEDGVPHLLWRADGPLQVLLLGHADTVFEAGTLARRPFRLQDGKAYGPGVFDMKAGLVVALEALALVASRGPAAAVSGVAMLVTGDEEVGSQTSRALIEEVAAPAGAVLVLEPSLDGDLKVGRSGGSFYDLYFRGRAAHAGLEPETGRNALLEMARWALDLPGLADPAVGTSLTPTVAKAGTAINVVPGQALLRVDVRAALGDEQRRVDHAVRDRVATHNAVLGDGVGVDLEGGINRPPLEPEFAAGLVRLCLEQAERIGQRAPGTAIVGGASDGNFTSALGVPTLDGLGPAGGGAHAAHEWVSLESFHDRIDLVAAVIEALLAPPG